MYHRGQRRTDILDTSDWAHRELVKLLRATTPERRMEIVLRSIQLGFALELAGRREREKRAS